MRVDGRPWSRPLPFLQKTHFPLYVKLREEGFIPDDLDRALFTLLSKSNVSRYHGGPRIYTLNDPFIIDFSKMMSYLLLITEKAIKKMRIKKMFHDQRNEHKTTPYTGAHTNLYPISLLLYWLFSWIYRKCLGSIWTFHTPRARRRKNRRVTTSQDNLTCEVCYSPLWWLHKLPKRRRASPERSESVECQYWHWQMERSSKYHNKFSITLECIVIDTSMLLFGITL